MRRLSLPYALAAGFYVVSCALQAASAQEAVRGIFVTPIPYQPLTAVVTVQRTMVLPNKTVISSHTTHLIARNAQGEIYNENRGYAPDNFIGLPPLLAVHIYDPQTRLNTFLYPNTMTGTQRRFPGPPASVPPDFYAVPNAAAVTRQNEFAKEEDLGWQKMLGLSVHGVRETQVVPAEFSGTGQEVAITDEYWYSQDVRLNLLVKHSDPRSETTVQTVTTLKQGEPEASLFVVSSDYKLNGMGMRMPGAAAMSVPTSR